MDIRKYRGLLEAGSVTYADIAAETGLDWRTVKKYLAEDAPVSPPGAGTPRAGTQPRLIDPFTGVIDGWLRADIRLKASVIHERLADGHGFTGNYQRVKMYVAEARPRIRRELEDQRDNPAGRGLHADVSDSGRRRMPRDLLVSLYRRVVAKRRHSIAVESTVAIRASPRIR